MNEFENSNNNISLAQCRVNVTPPIHPIPFLRELESLVGSIEPEVLKYENGRKWTYCKESKLYRLK